MKRRASIAMFGGAAAWPLVVRAQQPGKTYRLGYLSGGTAASRVRLLAAFRAGMRELGYVEGQHFVLETRFAEGKFDRLPSLARELLDLNPDALLVSTTPANLAIKAATSTLPVVMVGVADPLGVGLIASLARPGGNITGVTNIGAELAGKRLEILKELVPGATKVAVLINPDDPNALLQMESVQGAANKLAIRLEPILHIRSSADLKGAFEAAVRARADAAVRMIDPLVTALTGPTVVLAAEHRLPVIHPFRETVIMGGLISYGTSLPDQYRQTATFMHKILNGVKPSDLPVEQPTKFELTLNLQAAKALGLEVPSSLLARADEVIE